MKREISETHEALRFGINAGVKADLAPPHPLQSTIQSVRTHLSPLFSFTFPCRRNPNAESRCLGHALPHRRPNSGRTRKSSGRRPSTDPPSTSARISMPKSSPGPSMPLAVSPEYFLLPPSILSSFEFVVGDASIRKVYSGFESVC